MVLETHWQITSKYVDGDDAVIWNSRADVDGINHRRRSQRSMVRAGESCSTKLVPEDAN
jgi:hypothetical protein